MSDLSPTNLGRRRIIGEFVPGKFNSCFFKDLYPLVKLKKFIQDNTTNRILNHRWLIFQLEEQFFLSKEVSSLPPLADAIDRCGYSFFDIDFPDGEIEGKRLGDLGDLIPENQEVEVFYFLDKSLQESIDYDKMPITTIFFKNGIDFLRPTVLKGHDS